MRQHGIVLICMALFICMTFVRSTSLKTRQIYRTIRECQCPLRCIVSLRQCLISGTCRMCSLPNYGKRQKKKKSSEKMTKVISNYNFRKYRQTNWEAYFDTYYDKMQARMRPTVPYGLKTHNFRRIIGQKFAEKTMYLLEWENYELAEATWEPLSILPKNINSIYDYPEVSDEALTLVARQFESAVQRCLARRIKYKSVSIRPFSMAFPLDLFRYVFGTSDLGREYSITYTNGFSRLPMNSGWWYYIDKQYTRSQLAFPVCIQPTLTMRKVFKDINGKFEWRKQPVEKVRVTLSFEPLDKYSKPAE